MMKLFLITILGFWCISFQAFSDETNSSERTIYHPTCKLNFSEMSGFPNAIQGTVKQGLRDRGYKLKKISLGEIDDLQNSELFGHLMFGWCVLEVDNNPFLPREKICNASVEISIVRDGQLNTIIKNDIDNSVRFGFSDNLKERTLSEVLENIPNCIAE